MKAFLDVHSYSQKLLPPGCNGFAVKDTEEHLRAGHNIVQAMSNGGQKYSTGPCAGMMYTCSGTAADWAYNALQVTHSYSVEMRPSDEVLSAPGGNGFVVAPNEIEATGHELLAGITALAHESLVVYPKLIQSAK